MWRAAGRPRSLAPRAGQAPRVPGAAGRGGALPREHHRPPPPDPLPHRPGCGAAIRPLVSRVPVFESRVPSRGRAATDRTSSSCAWSRSLAFNRISVGRPTRFGRRGALEAEHLRHPRQRPRPPPPRRRPCFTAATGRTQHPPRRPWTVPSRYHGQAASSSGSTDRPPGSSARR